MTVVDHKPSLQIKGARTEQINSWQNIQHNDYTYHVDVSLGYSSVFSLPLR